MKKIATTVLIVCLIFVLSLGVCAKRVTELNTAGGESGFSMKITDKGIDISGVVPHEDMFNLIILTDTNYLVHISPGVRFSTSIKLPATEATKTEMSIYAGKNATSQFTGLFFKEDIVLEKYNGKWYFSVNDDAYTNNSQWLSGWIEPNAVLDRNQPNAVKVVTASVTEGLSGNYEKAQAIHKWIADNIYYDKDYALNRKTFTALTPVEVLTDRISVCEGYANLAVSMLNSAGIPAVTVKGYSLGADTPTSWSDVKNSDTANHMWVEAYVDGEWLIMDPTWDSKNMYYKSKKEKTAPIIYRYFDIDPTMLSATHKILDRPNVFGKTGVSSWALTEATAAYSSGLIPANILTTMKDKITREEFCDIVMQFMTVKLGKTTEQILEERKLELNYEFFKDTFDYNILAANALGIVNGKENNMFDPKGFITRQEAAVMLQRTAKALGVTTPNDKKIEFSDAKTFPAWSRDAIDFVSASMSNFGVKVMSGVENNKFDPKGFYTKEQSVLTIFRMYSAY